MQTKYKFIIGFILLLTAFSLGRYTVPLSEKIESEKIKVENKITKDDKSNDIKKHKDTVTNIVIKPDGTKEIRRETKSDEETKSKESIVSKDKTSETEKSSKEVTRKGDIATLSALAGTNISNLKSAFKPDYGGAVSKQVLGPINIGAFGFTSGFVGVSAGLSF